MVRLREKEEEALKKKKELVEQAKQKQMDKATRVQKLIETQGGDHYAWVEPRLNEQTKAAADKARTKYDARVDGPRSASTFGGQVTRSSGRAMVGWRQGL
jgi:hypothetical protein